MTQEAPQLTAIVPMFNEAATVGELLARLLTLPLRMQVVVVDDGSTDGSRQIVERFAQAHPEVELVCHEANRGKGAAVRSGIARARGAYTVVQDADLEYNPADLVRLLETAEREGASVVYGSRILGHSAASYRSFYWGGRLVSLVASLLYRQWITDEPTCYKMFKTELLRSLPLSEDGFGFCAEATALVLRRGHRIREVPISYRPRSFQQGKKIRWTDGVRAIWILLKHRFGRAR